MIKRLILYDYCDSLIMSGMFLDHIGGVYYSFSQKVIFILKTFKKCGGWWVVGGGGGKKLDIFVVYLYAKS